MNEPAENQETDPDNRDQDRREDNYQYEEFRATHDS